jgi:ATP-dependent RNA helicase RhlE
MHSSDSRPARSTSFSKRPPRRSFSSSRPRSEGSSAAPRGSSSTPAPRTGSRFIYPDSASSHRSSDRGGERRSFSGARTGGYSRGESSSGGYSRGGSSSYNRGGRSGGSRGRGRVMQTFDVSKFINLHPAPLNPETPYQATHTFKDFGLDARIVESITAMDITVPSAIQDQVIPHIMNGQDVVGLAQTGTGKTAAFLVPTIHKTLREPSRQTLVLTPTRELAIQVEQELRRLTPRMHLYSTVCVGGMNIRPQIMGLKRKNHFIIGTPGRVQDLLDRGHIKPGGITTVILDEADRMLDMGFIHDIKKILKDVPLERETLFFSATMSKTIEGLIHEFLRDPITISIKKNDIISSITQDVIRYEHHNKFDTLVATLKKPEFSRVIIFGAMKHSVEKLSLELISSGIKADAIHGNKSHGQRQRALKRFKDGQIQVLVATDVAARGIHVDDVSHVINYDLPNTYEDYVHRIGRTGRGSKQGGALTFVPA